MVLPDNYFDPAIREQRRVETLHRLYTAAGWPAGRSLNDLTPADPAITDGNDAC